MRRAGLALLLILLAAAHATTLRAPAVGLFHDDGIYLVTAGALAEGDGYRIASLPDPVPQTKYPPAFPALLSIAWHLDSSFPANALALKVVPLSALVLWCVMAYLLLRRWTADHVLAATIALLTAASPWMLFLGSALLAETWFAVFVWGALLLLVRREQGAGGNATLVVAAALAGAAFLTRTPGIALLVAGTLSLALRKRGKDALVFLAVSGAIALPWLVWVVTRSGNAPPQMAAYYGVSNYADWNLLLGFGWRQKLEIFGWNVLHLLLTPFRLLGAIPSPLWPVLLMVGSLGIVGFVRDVRRRFGVLHVFATVYIGMILLWAWPPWRFLAPVYPLLLFFGWRGLEAMVGRLPRVAAKAARGAMLVVVAAWSAWAVGRSVWTAAHTGVVCPGVPCPDRWEDFRETFAWVAENTPGDAVLVGNLDPTLYLYTGRKAVRPFTADPYELYYSTREGRAPLGTPRDLVARIEATGARYVVDTPHSLFGEEPFWQALLAETASLYPGLLEEVHRGTNPAFRVLRIDRGRLNDADGAGSHPAAVSPASPTSSR